MRTKNNNSTIKRALIRSCEYLKNTGIDAPETDVELLLAEAVGISRNELFINYNKVLTEDHFDKFRDLIQKRALKQPVDYILGYSVFMGLKFEVNAATLIPRPETELLVEKAIEFIKNKRGVRVLEIGSGSGNIAVSLAKFTGCEVVSIEKSFAAILVARKNAQNHNVEEKVKFLCGDMFNRISSNKKEFDLLVSNPPYVKFAEYDELPGEVKKEPMDALMGGDDGLLYIKHILKEGARYVKANGKIYLEIGYDQKEAVESIVTGSGFTKYQFIKDYNGIDRILEVVVV